MRILGFKLLIKNFILPVLLIIFIFSFLMTMGFYSYYHHIASNSHEYDIVTLADSKSSHQCLDQLGFDSQSDSNIDIVSFELLPSIHKFRSNHWFHLSEYYLSHYEDISKIYSSIQPRQVILLISDPQFLDNLTPTAMFILCLAFGRSSDSLHEINVVHPMHKSLNNISKLSYIEYADKYPVATYINRKEYRLQYTMKRDFSYTKSCTKQMGLYGKTPIPSSKWFQSKQTIINIRDHIKTLCPIERNPLPKYLVSNYIETFSSGANTDDDDPSSRYRLVLYQRDKTRKFSDIEELTFQLTKALSSKWIVQVISHEDDIHPCILYHTLSHADVFVTTHGFQSMALLFMKPGSVIFEVFPYKYFKNTYASISQQYGIHHFYSQSKKPYSKSRLVLSYISQEFCMSSIKCRSFSRGDDILISPENDIFITPIQNISIQIEKGILGPHNAPYIFDKLA